MLEKALWLNEANFFYDYLTYLDENVSINFLEMKEDEKSAIKSSIIEKWRQLKVIVLIGKRLYYLYKNIVNYIFIALVLIILAENFKLRNSHVISISNIFIRKSGYERRFSFRTVYGYNQNMAWFICYCFRCEGNSEVIFRIRITGCNPLIKCIGMHINARLKFLSMFTKLLKNLRFMLQ